MIYDLPVSVNVGGAEYSINSDYRAILDIMVALADPELNGQEKAVVALGIFYPGLDAMPPECWEDALKQCFWFINCGDEHQNRKAPVLMNWEQDFKYIVAPINRVVGEEVRNMKYLHWWTFISYYYEIGDCLFAQIVRIRNLRAKGKKLDKADREFYRQNRELVDIKMKYTEAENDMLKDWLTVG